MSSATRKPPVPGRQASGAPASRSPTPSSSLNPSSNPATRRRNTVLGGREGAFSHRGSISGGSSPLTTARAAARHRLESNNDAELENAAQLEDLRSQLAKSESAAEAAAQEYTKQIQALQIRLDESSTEQVKMEEAMHAKDEVIEALEIQVNELTRSKRDQENIYEAERIAAQQEKEELLDREEELNTVIQRLKDTLAQREERDSGRSSAEQSGDESGKRGRSLNNLVLAKDKLIEGLRLELAEAQVRLAEADHLGGTKLQILEQQLMEARMTNARLMEDNESFQLLLSSAALNGDFPRGDYMNNAFSDAESTVESTVDSTMDAGVTKKVQGSPRSSVAMGGGVNLADELEDAETEKEEETSEKYRKLEAEFKQLKDQNKAMSLYINNIIERILMHKDSEAILDKTASTNAQMDTQKPPPPKPKEEPQGFFQRTKSFAMRRGPPVRTGDGEAMQRSQSVRSVSSHKRSQSEATGIYTGSIVNSMYRGDSAITPRTATFSGMGEGNYTSRRPRDSSASVDSGVSDTTTGELHSPSPPPQGPIVGKQLRPLTLVQKNVGNGMMSPPLGQRKLSGDLDDDAQGKTDQRASKRASWFGLFNRGKEEQTLTNNVVENVVFERADVE